MVQHHACDSLGMCSTCVTCVGTCANDDQVGSSRCEESVAHAGETAFDMAMRRASMDLIRHFTPRAKFSANIQVKESTMLGFRGEYRERHMVLAPREPLLDTAQAQGPRTIHTQLLIFASHLEPRPTCKLWTDGASMTREHDKFLLHLHHTHAKPINVRVDVDPSNLFCVCFRASQVAGHEAQLERLSSIVNSTLRAAHGHSPGQPAHGEQLRPTVSQPLPNLSHDAHGSHPVAVNSAPITPAGPSSRVNSSPLAMSAAAAAMAAAGGQNSGSVYAPSGMAPSAPPGGGSGGCSGAPPPPPLPQQGSQAQGGEQLSDEEMAARLQQAELVQARMTDQDLQQQMSRLRTSRTGTPSSASWANNSAATPPVPPPPAGDSSQAASNAEVCVSTWVVMYLAALTSPSSALVVIAWGLSWVKQVVVSAAHLFAYAYFSARSFCCCAGFGTAD